MRQRDIDVSELALRTAIGTYGQTRGLKDGTVASPRFSMEQIEVSPIPMIFRRMVRNLEFDVSEMALSTYLCARAHGKAFTGIPVFLTRSFYHGGIAYNKKSGIKSPDDLAGRKVGVRSYTLTPGVWTRALLQHEYGLDLDSVTWVLTGDEHVAEYVAPKNVVSSESNDLNEMLLSGEIDAAIGAAPSDSPDIARLFPDADEADARWFQKTGVYPISHMVVVKNEQLENNPWLAEELFKLFSEARKPYIEQLKSGNADNGDLKRAKIVGGDPLPYGFESSRKTLETFVHYNLEQRVIPDWVDPAELFPASTLDLD
jgi:4,5-dihydroxyphthalate decarboxylase